ncbi:MarR family transcriptional regulator [Muricauda sp. NFXS6]|uniref:MarR family winged helix-turn-helix transcriptional regulator n=1 Tax=Allomuricauda sp. NFXS6 TaxID=2819094 RepID=UPI0032DF2009
MEPDYLKTLEYLGMTARVKRLSDNLFYSIRKLYQEMDIDIEPSWHLVFLILKEQGEVGMLDFANILNLSKPAVTKMIRKMEDMGYVQMGSDPSDSRRKLVSLSSKAEQRLPQFESVWDAGQLAVQQLLETNPHFMGALELLEQQLEEQNFCDRAIKNIHT